MSLPLILLFISPYKIFPFWLEDEEEMPEKFAKIDMAAKRRKKHKNKIFTFLLVIIPIFNCGQTDIELYPFDSNVNINANLKEVVSFIRLTGCVSARQE